MGCLENENNGSAILWQIEHNGSWNWEVSYTCNSLYLKLSGPSEQKNHWWLDLKSSMKFKTVPAAISFGANGFDSAVCEMTKYRRKIVNRKGTPVNADPTTEKVLPLVDRAAETDANILLLMQVGMQMVAGGMLLANGSQLHIDSQMAFRKLQTMYTQKE